jgi:DNA-directed RNA polymerase specialized sigma24 family protein
MYHEDLYQEGMIAAWRILERDPGMYGRTLVRLCVLAMYAARRRGRSIFRADPADRQRVYEQVVFDPQEVAEAEQWIDWGMVEQLAGDENLGLEGNTGVQLVDPSLQQW